MSTEVLSRPPLSNAQRRRQRKEQSAHAKWEAKTGSKTPKEATAAVEKEPPPGIDPANLALPTNQSVVIGRDVAQRIVRARRQDVFDLFQARGKLSAGAYDAVRRLQDDIAVLHRAVSGGGDLTPRVDRTSKPQSFNDARLAAGARIEEVLNRAGPASARLLVALCEPAVIEGRGADWRDVVVRVTGERLPDAQSAILRVACENLAGAYQHASSRRTPPNI